MKVPRSLLPHRVTVKPYQGASGAAGPVYGAPRTVRARVEGRRRAIRTSLGVDVVSTATVFVRPDETIPAQSRLSHCGLDYEVLENNVGQGLTSAVYRELILDGPL